jgi:plasmid maintenance system antidote protein VapI
VKTLKTNRNYFDYLLKEKNISKHFLAEKMNCSTRTLNLKFKGERKITLEDGIIMSLVLKESMQKIFYKEYEHKKNELEERIHAS